jgi:hypothetical protein
VLAPRYLNWGQLGGPVRMVLVNGVATEFDEALGGVTVALPTFEKTLKIELVR